jgi:hypothetical protein
MNTTGQGRREGEETVSSRLHALLREAHLTAHSLAKKLPNGPDRVTISRILADPNHCPRLSSLEPIEEHFERPGYLTEVLEQPESSSRAFRPDRLLVGTWYEQVPKQAGRNYESIDLVQLRRTRSGEFRGSIERVLSTRSPTDVGEAWEAMGMAREERFLYLVFYSVSDNRPDSNGAIALRRDRSYRRLYGGYLRFRDDDSQTRSVPPMFRLNWHRDASEAAEKSSWSSEDISESGGQ